MYSTYMIDDVCNNMFNFYQILCRFIHRYLRVKMVKFVSRHQIKGFAYIMYSCILAKNVNRPEHDEYYKIMVELANQGSIYHSVICHA